MHLGLKKYWHFWRSVFQQYFKNQYTYHAAALTFSSLLSIVPLMTVIIAVLSAFPLFKTVTQQIENFLFSHLVVASGEAVQRQLHDIINHALQLSGLSFLFLIIVAIQMIFTIEQTFNEIWEVKQKRNFFSAIALYLVLLITGPLFMGSGFIISSYLLTHSFLPKIITYSVFFKFFVSIMPFFLSVITFSLVYIIVPNCHVALRSGFLAGLTVAILFETAKTLFSIYIEYFSSYEVLYGSLSAIPIFLMWIYISWCMILIGAVISKALQTITKQTLESKNY